MFNMSYLAYETWTSGQDAAEIKIIGNSYIDGNGIEHGLDNLNDDPLTIWHSELNTRNQ